MAKGIVKRRKTQFKKGHSSYIRIAHEVQHQDQDAESNVVAPYRRITQSMLKSLADPSEDSPQELLDSVKLGFRLLRPRPDAPELIDEHAEPEAGPSSAAVSQDSDRYDEYRLVHKGRTQKLWNIAIKEHVDCQDELVWDNEREVKWGLCWIEGLTCLSCGYKSTMHKLFIEKVTGKRGRRPGEPNIALQVGLSHTSAGNSAIRTIFTTTGIPPPSESGLQKAANKVTKAIETLNIADMESHRENLKEICVLKGKDPKLGIMAETDCCYSVPLQNAGSRTPMQPSGQVVTTIAENETQDKKIISAYLGNKHCAVAKFMLSKGEIVQCPHHKGVCTQNIQPEASIGDESRNVELAYRAMQSTTQTAIHAITTDGDSRAASAISKVNNEMGFVEPVNYRDTRHLSENQCRFLRKLKFSKGMFPGTHKPIRDRQQKFFALNVKRRCYGEFAQAFSKFKGNVTEIKAHLLQTTKAVLECYSGDCGDSCIKFSLLCNRDKGKAWQHDYLCDGEELTMTDNDLSLLKEAVLLRLGPDAVDKTQKNKNTQKSEATNRSVRRSLPRNTLYMRNASGRMHSAIHVNNNGIGNSTILKLKKLGLHVPKGTLCMKALKKDHCLARYHKTRQRSKEYRERRRYHCIRRHMQYKSRDHKSQNITYAKGLMDSEQMKQTLTRISNEHCYTEGPDNFTRALRNTRSRITHDHSYV